MDGNIPIRTSGRGRGNTAAAEPPSVRQSWTGRIIIVFLVVCVVVALVNAATKDYKSEQRSFYKSIGRDDLAQDAQLMDDAESTASSPMVRLQQLELEVKNLRGVVAAMAAKLNGTQHTEIDGS